LAVTLERFLAVSFPLREFRRKRLLLPAAVFFAVVYNLPKYFEVRKETGGKTVGRGKCVLFYVSVCVFWPLSRSILAASPTSSTEAGEADEADEARERAREIAR